ncbi:MAG TPA: PA2169 family four-helix-bundle protein [Anseongella sp.]|nr:PA2169 family four-helix-bundle protein [Anseongella sp.]
MNQTAEMIDQLNKLVTINNDRIEGYRKASEETSNADLKILFGQYAEQSVRFRNELAAEITALGGEVEEGTSTSGKIYRAWMDVRHAMSNNDKKAVLKSCEYGEDVALEAYNEVLDGDVPYAPAFRVRLENQRSELRDAHDSIKSLRDVVA